MNPTADNRPIQPPLQPLDTARLKARPVVVHAEKVVRLLRDAGHEAYFVGGFVRNALLGRPIQDVDIATSATPDQVEALFEETKAVGAHFGVILVRLGTHVFEVATFRAEGAYVDRRHPTEVRFGSLDEDHLRRDFTVNAMYWDPLANRLIDPAGGREDLVARRLRTVGDPDRRFSEDALRLMRAVRFAVAYDLEIEPATHAAIVRHADTLREISIERIADELLRILTGPHPGRAMHLMSELGLWSPIIPEIDVMHGVEQPPMFHPEGDVFVHTAIALDLLAEGWTQGAMPPELALAGLLHDIGKPPTFMETDRIRFPEHQSVGAKMAEAICRRLHLSMQIQRRVVDLIADHMRFRDVRNMKQSTMRRLVAREDFDLHLALHRADCLASHGKVDNYHYCLAERRRLAELDAQQRLLPDPILNGKDLIGMGLKPGPLFGRLLEAVREEQLDGRLHTRVEAIEWAKRWLAANREE